MTADLEQLATVKKKPGPRPSGNALVFKSVGLPAWAWEWLALWFPSGNPSEQLRELLDRASRFWPAGPNRFR